METYNKSRVRPALFLLLGLAMCYLGFKYTRHTICIERSKHVEKDVDTLVEELDSSFSCIRSRAAFDLQKLNALGKPAIPQLLALLDDPSDIIRWRSVAALGHIGVWTEESKARVYEMFEDSNKTTRLNTLFAIGRMRYDLAADGKRPDYYHPKPLSKDALMIFRQALDDPVPMVVVKAMLHFDPKELKTLNPALQNDFIEKFTALRNSANDKVRFHALLTLMRLLPAEKIKELEPDYMEQIRRLTKSDDEMLRIRSLRAEAKARGKKLPLLMDGARGQASKFERRCNKEGRKFGPYASCFYLGELYEYKGDTERAYEYYEKGCGTTLDDSVAGCEKLGDRALAAGDIPSAKEYYERSAKLYGTRSDALVKLASLLSEEGEHENACHWLVLSCGNRNEKACEQGASCEGLAEALAARKKANQFNGKAHVELTNKAHEEARKGNVKAAIEMLENARSQGNVFAATTLSDIYVEAGRVDDAVTLLEDACQKMESLSCNWLGRLYRRQGKPAEAEKALKRACNIDPRGCAEDLAYFYSQRGEKEKAREQYRLLCNLTYAERREENCEKAKVQSLPENVAELEKECLAGTGNSCQSLRAVYDKHLAQEKTVALDKRLCEADRTFWSCRRYLDSVKFSGQFDTYDELLSGFCPDGVTANNVEACMSLAARKKELGEHGIALELKQDACLQLRQGRYCRMMHRAARTQMSDAEYRSFLQSLCDSESEETSCLALALRDDAEEGAVKHALTLMLERTSKECRRGSSLSCAEEGIVRCALGQKIRGRALLFGACKIAPKTCVPAEECTNALSLIKKRFQ